MQIIRDRSLKVPSIRRDMLKRTQQEIEMYMYAEKLELDSFERLKVWELVPRPRGVNVMKVRWCYDHKYTDEGKLVKYKARLVAKGFAQVQG